MNKSEELREGICYIVGAGPGDPGLLTLRAQECLRRAEVVFYDYLCNPEILHWAPESAQRFYVGKKAGDHAVPQAELNQRLVDEASKGKTIVRLKGGDPYLFGRGAEEAMELEAAGIAYEIVPGISSAIAGPAYAGIPVTHRAHNSQLTIFTGHEDPVKGQSSLDYAQLAQSPGTKVMLMGVERLPHIVKSLLEAGASAQLPVSLVRWATTQRQQSLSGVLVDIVEKVQRAKFEAPAVVVFGEVAQLGEKLNWFERKPLFGKRVVVTRTRAQAGALTKELRELGADVIEIPTIRIEPPTDKRGFYELVAEAHRYEWIFFTSPNGVDAFFKAFFEIYKDARSLGGARLAAIGSATAEKIRDYHFGVDLVPEKAVAEGLLESFLAEVGSVENQTLLWVRAESARDVLSRGLVDRGAILDEAIAYRTVAEKSDLYGAQKRFRQEGADWITFTSSSTVENFMALELPLPDDIKFASIGPITSQKMREYGLEVHLEAQKHDIPGLVKAIREHYL